MDKHLKYTREILATTVFLPQGISTHIKLFISIVYWIPLRTVQLSSVFMLLEMATTTTKILIASLGIAAFMIHNVPLYERLYAGGPHSLSTIAGGFGYCCFWPYSGTCARSVPLVQ